MQRYPQPESQQPRLSTDRISLGVFNYCTMHSQTDADLIMDVTESYPSAGSATDHEANSPSQLDLRHVVCAKCGHKAQISTEEPAVSTKLTNEEKEAKGPQESNCGNTASPKHLSSRSRIGLIVDGRRSGKVNVFDEYELEAPDDAKQDKFAIVLRFPAMGRTRRGQPILDAKLFSSLPHSSTSSVPLLHTTRRLD